MSRVRPSFKVLRADGSLSHHLKPVKAGALVHSGDAVVRRRGELEINRGTPCKQEITYFQFGIEKYPHIVQGGLTRTETRPAPIDPFKGATVGSLKQSS